MLVANTQPTLRYDVTTEVFTLITHDEYGNEDVSVFTAPDIQNEFDIYGIDCNEVRRVMAEVI